MAIDAGMDLEAVSGILSQLHGASSQLSSVITTTQQAVGNLENAWKGADANQFSSSVWPSHHAALTNALNALNDMITHTQANYNQQQQTSTSYA